MGWTHKTRPYVKFCRGGRLWPRAVISRAVASPLLCTCICLRLRHCSMHAALRTVRCSFCHDGYQPFESGVSNEAFLHFFALYE